MGMVRMVYIQNNVMLDIYGNTQGLIAVLLFLFLTILFK